MFFGQSSASTAYTTTTFLCPSLPSLPTMSSSIITSIESTIGKTIKCSHCHGARPLSCFSQQLEKLWDGEKLKRIPKICDAMVAINAKHNKVNNDVNNTKRSLVRYETMLAEAPENKKTALSAKVAAVTKRLDAAKQRLLEHQKTLTS